MNRTAVAAALRDWRVAVVSVAAVVVYARWFPSAGTGDVDIWLGWIRNLAEDGLRATYAAAHRDYPPGSLILLEFPRMLVQTAGIGLLPALKTLLVIGALGAAIVVYAWSGKPLYAVWFLLAVAVNVVVDGYLDILMAAPLLLALRALERRHLAGAGALYAAAAAVKWQPLIIGPFVLVEACRRSRRSPRWIGALAGASGFGIGALIVAGALVSVFDPAPVLAAFRLAFQHTSLSLQGLNLNWLVQLAVYVQSRSTGEPYDVDVPAVITLLARVTFWTTYVLVFWLFVRRGRQFEDFVWYSCLAFYSYCMLNIGVHENHLFLAVVLAFALLCTGHPQAPGLAACMAVSATVNLLLFYDLGGHRIWSESAPLSSPALVTASVVASVLNLVLWMVLVYRTVRTRPAAAEPDVTLTAGGPQVR
jgi:hypothetical protein